MRANLEDDLTRTLHAAAQAGPEPDPEFPVAVARRRRRRSQTRLAGVALLTLVVAGTAGIAGLRQSVGPPIGPAPTADVSAMPAVDLGTAKSYAETWPEAIVKLPSALPDGRQYNVEAALGGDEYLAVPWGAQGAEVPVVINSKTGAVRVLQTPPKSGYQDWAQGGFAVTPNYLVWVIQADEDGGARHREVWSAPRAGGDAVLRARFGPETTDPVSVAEVDGVFFAEVNDKASVIYRLSGSGEPQQVPGSDGQALLYGPWAIAGEHGQAWDPLAPSPAPRPAPTFWNVATGERRTPLTPAGVTMIDCSPAECLGGVGESLISYGADGGRPLRTTGIRVEPSGRTDAFFSADGRFVQVRAQLAGQSEVAAREVFLWDRKTNTAARQTEHQGTIGIDVLGLTDIFAKGATKTVVDLTRIP